MNPPQAIYKIFIILNRWLEITSSVAFWIFAEFYEPVESKEKHSLLSNKEATQFWKWTNHNLLTPKSDWHLTSPYNITPESNMEVVRIKGMIIN